MLLSFCPCIPAAPRIGEDSHSPRISQLQQRSAQLQELDPPPVNLRQEGPKKPEPTHRTAAAARVPSPRYSSLAVVILGSMATPSLY